MSSDQRYHIAGLFYPSDHDANNTTAFVGNVNTDITEEDLYNVFKRCGDIVSVKLLKAKGCAFITYANRSAAERAINYLHGKVRLSSLQGSHSGWIVKFRTFACRLQHTNYKMSIALNLPVHVCKIMFQVKLGRGFFLCSALSQASRISIRLQSKSQHHLQM